MISECESYITIENSKQSAEKLNEIAEFWMKNQKLYRILVEGNYCEKISESLSMAQMSFNIQEFSDTFNNLNECKATLKHILEKEKLSLEAVL